MLITVKIRVFKILLNLDDLYTLDVGKREIIKN